MMSKENYLELNLLPDEEVEFHQNDVQCFYLIKNGAMIETRYFGDIFVTNLRIIFVDRKLQTEFSLPFNIIDHIFYKKRCFAPNFIKILSSENDDHILWNLEFEGDGASQFKNQLKKSSIAEKVSNESFLSGGFS